MITVQQHAPQPCKDGINPVRVEGISSYPIMEVPVSKTRLQTEQKSSGIMCHLYEARKVDMPIKLNHFVETVKDIDPDLGLLQTCELNTGNGTDNQQEHLALISLVSERVTSKLQVIYLQFKEVHLIQYQLQYHLIHHFIR